ncbi:universal stress protein [Ornithinimicrobium humiphilum]|uniref:Nucleotide-binding universal stress UspA family protein n=1 Tax=Ornithinimicrobium humiphilum TaxID=125288 RepID=A0A543K820_9MICO|nr:universal stress protein [Ornithinimicrobium humiphilum]TQM91210.1 nucleotide-binding universal stress UspA family protein [Ornithinimicrobium humiphilum]
MSYSKVLVPVVPGHGEEAWRAVEVARSLAGDEGTVTIITVVEDLPRYLTAEAYAVDPGLMESQREVAKAVVDEFLGQGLEVQVAYGHPTREILDEAEKGGYDCIVIASSQPGWKHFFLGSTASGVVRHAHCSVHVLREKPTA